MAVTQIQGDEKVSLQEMTTALAALLSPDRQGRLVDVGDGAGMYWDYKGVRYYTQRSTNVLHMAYYGEAP